MKKIKHIFEYILVLFWLGLIYILPLNLSCKITAYVFVTVGNMLSVSKKAAKNLKKIFTNLTDKEAKKLIDQVWENLGYIVAETPYLLGLSNEDLKKHVKVVGFEHLEGMRNKPAIFYSAHLGNWELIGKSLDPYGIVMNGIYREANNKLVDRLINKLRSRHVKGRLIPKGKDGAKLLIKALSKNEFVFMLVDQRMDNGISVPFLNNDAMTAPAIATLALKYDSPIVPIQVVRKENSNFEVIIHPIMDISNKNVEEIMREININIGEWVRQNPGQWFWLHRRWGK